jgi:hypothetical protein
MVDKISREKGLDLPTQVQDIYKVRRGRYNHIRIWSKVDLGTCRTEDLFVTDVNGNEINITVNKYLIDEDEINTVANQIALEKAQAPEPKEEEVKTTEVEKFERKEEKAISFKGLF